MAANKDNAMNTTDTTTTMAKPRIEGEGIFARMWHTIVHFLREVQVELKKTSWPTRDELTKFTIVVMVTIVIVSLFLFVSDLVIGQIANRLFHVQAPR